MRYHKVKKFDAPGPGAFVVPATEACYPSMTPARAPKREP